MTQAEKMMLKKMLVEQAAGRLTDWEDQFIDSIKNRSSLTPGQSKKLEEIFNER